MYGQINMRTFNVRIFKCIDIIMFGHSNVGQSSRMSQSFKYPDIIIY